MKRIIYLLWGGGLLEINPDDSAQYFEFTASDDGSAINFFGSLSTIPENTYYEVNGVKQETKINALTFKTGDNVKIVYGPYTYSIFDCDGQNYMSSIRGRVPKVKTRYFSKVFYECYSLVSIPEELFYNNPQITSFSSAFYRVYDISIPEKLFAKCPNVTSFSSAFQDCDLTTIPENLFANNPNVTTFSYCFNGCNLTEIPENLFAHNPNVTNFSYCFHSNYNLTTIPEGLFAHNPNVTNFSYCFRFCDSLSRIPAGLFKYNTHVTNFRDTFQRTSISEIPASLFATNTEVTSFYETFYNTAITAVPQGLFDNNPNVTDFSYCFQSNDNLTTIPLDLFDKNEKVEDMDCCFRYCSKLQVNLQIGSRASRFSMWEFATDCKSGGTIYVHAGTKAEEEFRAMAERAPNYIAYGKVENY